MVPIKIITTKLAIRRGGWLFCLPAIVLAGAGRPGFFFFLPWHSGGGIGAGCGLLYIPSHKTYTFFSTNLGVLVESELVKKAGGLRDAILATLLQ